MFYKINIGEIKFRSESRELSWINFRDATISRVFVIKVFAKMAKIREIKKSKCCENSLNVRAHKKFFLRKKKKKKKKRIAKNVFYCLFAI